MRQTFTITDRLAAPKVEAHLAIFESPKTRVAVEDLATVIGSPMRRLRPVIHFVWRWKR
jgi:hypothetical protein